MRFKRKFKVQISRPDGSTVHGVVRAHNQSDVQKLIKLPNGHGVNSIQEVDLNHACFYDRDFESMVEPEGLTP